MDLAYPIVDPAYPILDPVYQGCGPGLPRLCTLSYIIAQLALVVDPLFKDKTIISNSKSSSYLQNANILGI